MNNSDITNLTKEVIKIFATYKCSIGELDNCWEYIKEIIKQQPVVSQDEK